MAWFQTGIRTGSGNPTMPTAGEMLSHHPIPRRQDLGVDMEISRRGGGLTCARLPTLAYTHLTLSISSRRLIPHPPWALSSNACFPPRQCLLRPRPTHARISCAAEQECLFAPRDNVSCTDVHGYDSDEAHGVRSRSGYPAQRRRSSGRGRATARSEGLQGARM